MMPGGPAEPDPAMTDLRPDGGPLRPVLKPERPRSWRERVQRLLRTLCPHCKQPMELNRAEDGAAWDALVAPFTAKRPASVYKPVGCLECRMTGYMGRVGIYETLVHSPGIKQLIAEGADLGRVREQAMKEGMKPLRISGAMKVAAGLTTIDEVLKVAPPVREPAG